MHRIVCLLVLLCATATALSAAGPTSTAVRVFTLQNATVIEAFSAIEALLSDRGSVTVQPSLKRITIQDVPAVVERISAVMGELDRVPGEYRIEVELVKGLDVDGPSDLPPELDRRLHRMFPFTSYRRAGRAVFEGELGQPTAAAIGGDYRLSFLADLMNTAESTPWGVADAGTRTQVKWLRLDRLRTGPRGEEQVDELLRTTVLLSPKQKMIIGAGSSEDSGSGLVLILTMHSVKDR